MELQDEYPSNLEAVRVFDVHKLSGRAENFRSLECPEGCLAFAPLSVGRHQSLLRFPNGRTYFGYHQKRIISELKAASFQEGS